MRKAAKRFKVEPNKICKWWDEIDYIKAYNPKKRWLEGAARLIEDKNIEEKLQEKICSGRSRKLSVSGKLIVTKTKTLYDFPSTDNLTSQGTFVVSRGWLQKFMKRMDYFSVAFYYHLIFDPWFLTNWISARKRPHRILTLRSYIPLPEIPEIGLYSELPVTRTSKGS